MLRLEEIVQAQPTRRTAHEQSAHVTIRTNLNRPRPTGWLDLSIRNASPWTQNSTGMCGKNVSLQSATVWGYFRIVASAWSALMPMAQLTKDAKMGRVDEGAMKFSLVLGTMGRSSELQRFLESLAAQTHAHVQLIIVDQNQDDRVAEVLQRVSLGIEVHHIQSTPGLSHARNVGLRVADGDVIAFPDDDCWYSPNLLNEVSDILSLAPHLDGVTGSSWDENGRPSGGRLAAKSGPIGLFDVWAKGISYTIFLRKEVCDAVGDFDETLGVGAGTAYGSGEETDYLIRALKAGKRLSYCSELQVFHPNKDEDRSAEKSYKYGAGMGRVLSKHRYPWLFRVSSVLKPALGSALALFGVDRPLVQARWSRSVGRAAGMMSKDLMEFPRHS